MRQLGLGIGFALRLVLGIAGSLAASGAANASLVTHLSQNAYDVDVDPASDLLGASGFSGAQTTSYSTVAATTGSGVILSALAGESNLLTQELILHFSAKPGFTFTDVGFSHLLAFEVAEGSYYAQMSWQVTPSGGAAQSGQTTQLTNSNWFMNGAYSDFTQASPVLAVNADAFDLHVTLHYRAAGFPGGCSSPSGVCAQIAAAAVKISANTVAVPVAEPSASALAMSAIAAIYARRSVRRR
jgi:hypothetical protein